MARFVSKLSGTRTDPRIRKAAIELTETAAERVKTLLDRRDPRPLGVRVSLRHRGCNGMSYSLNYVDIMDEKVKHDEIVQDKGVTVFVDSRALLNVIGTQMDYIEGDVASEFVFRNPNAKVSS